MASNGPAAEAARAAFRELMDARGHAVENARMAVAGLDTAFGGGVLVRTLLLGHFSSRYKSNTVLLEEALPIFSNTLLTNEGAVFRIDQRSAV